MGGCSWVQKRAIELVTKQKCAEKCPDSEDVKKLLCQNSCTGFWTINILNIILGPFVLWIYLSACCLVSFDLYKVQCSYLVLMFLGQCSQKPLYECIPSPCFWLHPQILCKCLYFPYVVYVKGVGVCTSTLS